MKKTILYPTLMLLAITSSFLTSCSKDDGVDNVSYESEHFLTNYMENSGLRLHRVYEGNNDWYEFGIQFKPTVAGKITAIRVAKPKHNSALRVRVWDTESNTILRTESVNVAEDDTAYIFDIDDVELQKNKSYAVTMYSSDYYYYMADNEITYPIDIGNLSIEKNIWVKANLEMYPENTLSNYAYAGDISFDFLRTK